MKFHHFALLFVVIAIGFFVTSQTLLVTKMQRESMEQTEYDCLVAAINATVEDVFSGVDNTVTEAGMAMAEETFFRTLTVLREGATDQTSWKAMREFVPCLVIFEERGYYQYYFEPGTGYGWTSLIPYKEGTVPKDFFEETEILLKQYHSVQHDSQKKYGMKQAETGIWEQSIKPPCVFAIYAPQSISLQEDSVKFLYAAAGRKYETYYVTEDNYCHLPFCEKCIEGRIIARYATQKESAEDGAIPCGKCLK